MQFPRNWICEAYVVYHMIWSWPKERNNISIFGMLSDYHYVLVISPKWPFKIISTPGHFPDRNAPLVIAFDLRTDTAILSSSNFFISSCF